MKMPKYLPENKNSQLEHLSQSSKSRQQIKHLPENKNGQLGTQYHNPQSLDSNQNMKAYKPTKISSSAPRACISLSMT